MIQIVELPTPRRLTLEDYASDAKFVTAVADLRAEAARIKPLLKNRTLWMINSTAQGGGVAEMLPRMIFLLREVDIDIKWAVISTEEQPFFHLTKRLHNLIHGDGRAGTIFNTEDVQLFESVNRENAESFKQYLKSDDILLVHDPQPLPLGLMLSHELGLTAIWRCHIGLDQKNEATRAAWTFLRPYLRGYQHAAFSASEYIPSFLAGKSSIIYPALDPISHKNRDLSVAKLVGILCNSGLQQDHEPLPTDDYEDQVMRITPNGEVAIPGEFGLLFRPIILQISRWDRLKGWLPLLDGFIHLRTKLTDYTGLNERNIKRLQLSRLVLAGPDPASIADDPEGLEVFEQIRSRYLSLDPELQKDIVILQLPMASRKENALIVNALQRSATIIVQNSLQEGFGLTVAEAMWKNMAVVGSSACGIRQQIRDGIDGRLIKDPQNSEEIAQTLWELLVHPRQRYVMGRSAQRRVNDEFLVFRQLSRYFHMLHQTLQS